MSSKLRDTLELLQSEKVKDRVAGIESLRSLLSTERALDAITTNSGWPNVFNKLFRNVVTERNLHVKKPLAATELRLKTAAGTVRWLVERSVKRLQRKAYRPLHTHLLQMCVAQKQLFTPVAGDYIKSLRVLLEYTPHLEHLDPQEWHSTTTFCFSALFGDEIKGPVDILRESDDPMELDELDELEEQEERDGLGGSQSNGRAGQREADLMACIERLFSSSSAPLATYANDLLMRFVRFFRMFPAETTAHLYAVGALADLLQEAEFNAIGPMTAVAPALWTVLLELWMSKLPALREGLAVCFRLLFPFIKRQEEPQALLEAFWRKIKADIDVRWRIEDLRLDAISLLPQDPAQPCPYETATFRMGPAFPTSQALAWHMLELAADCLAALYAQSDLAQPVGTTPRPSKRQKLENPLSQAMGELADTTSPHCLHRLQVLVFLIDRHWSQLHDAIKVEIAKALGDLLSKLDAGQAQLHSWAFIAIARLSGLFDVGADAEVAPWAKWWTTATKRLATAPICRAASHAVESLMVHSRIMHAELVAAVQSLLEQDLLVVGPTFPHDSTCSLLARCLRFASRDTHLFRLNLGAKVTSWLGLHLAYTPRTPLDVPQLVSLCRTIACGRTGPTLSRTLLLPAGRLGDFAQYRLESEPMRRLVFDAELAEMRNGSSVEDLQVEEEGAAAALPETGLLAILERALCALTTEMGETEQEAQVFWMSLTMDKLRFILDIAVTLLLFWAICEHAGSGPTQQQLSQACDLLRAALNQLKGAHRAAREKWTLFCALEPLLVPRRFEMAGNVMVQPSITSEVPEAVLHRSSALVDMQTAKTKEMLGHLWKVERVYKAFEGAQESLLRYLGTERDSRDMEEDIKGDAAFAERVAPVSRSGVTMDTDANLATAFAPLAVRFVLSRVHLSSGGVQVHEAADLIPIVEECEAEEALPIVETIVEAVRQGYTQLSPEQGDSILERIGGEFLPSYVLGRSPRCQLLGLAVLQATMLLWYDRSDATGFPANARKLCEWYGTTYSKTKMTSSLMRQRLASFLDSYLKLDPREDSWDGDPSPVELLVAMTGDVDFRVRYAASTSPGRLFPLKAKTVDMEVPKAHRALVAMYGKHTPKDSDNVERNLTMILVLSNTMISCSSQRVDTYNHLVTLTTLNQDFERYVAAALDVVAQRLGLIDRADLYTYMILPYTHRHKRSPSKLSATVTGFPTLQAAVEATFAAAGSAWLALNQRESFTAHCQLAGRPRGEGVTQCFPLAAALLIAQYFDKHEDDGAAIHLVSMDLETLAGESDLEEKDWQKLVINSADRIAAELCLLVWESAVGEHGSHIAAWEQVGRSEAPKHWWNLISSVATKELARPIYLNYQALTVARALRWLDSLSPIFNHAPTVYRVCQIMLDRIAGEHFVHEQLAELYNLYWFLSACWPQTQHPGIFRLLVHGFNVLMSQGDLLATVSRTVQTLLNSLLRDTSRQPIPALGSLVLQGARALAERAAHGPSEYAMKDAGELLNYSERILGNMLGDEDKEEGSVKQAALQAAALWPRPLTTPVEIRFEDLKEILESSNLAYGKFALSLPFSNAEAEVEDLPTIIWSIMSSLSDAEQPSTEQITAFAELLLKSGCATKPAWRPPNIHDELRPIALDIDIQNNIVEAIARLLAAPSLPTMAKAAQALHLMSALSAEGAFKDAGRRKGACAGEFELLADAQLLRRHEARGLRVEDEARDLQELDTDRWRTAGRDFSRWVTAIAQLIADIRFQTHMVYGQLGPLLADPAFARQVVPMLVHSLLNADLAASPSQVDAIALSNYFEALLADERTDLECVRCIIDIVSYLRSFRQVASTPSTYDKWLPQLSWLALSRGAARCSMHTTALLFLELEKEYCDLDLGDSDEARDLLYTIYERIDEPDGFYGIPVLDPADAVLRRYRHEGRPLDAFGLRGAQFEAGGSNTLSLVESISEHGLNRLAFSLLEPARSSGAIREEAIPKDLPFHMAWRSGSWALPVDEREDRSSAASIYAALRAIHRERDASVVSATIRKAFSIEVKKLITVDLNSPSPDHLAVRALVDLHEIYRWQQHVDPLEAITSCSQDIGASLSFEHVADIYHVRSSLLSSVVNNDRLPENITDAASRARHDCLLRLSAKSRQAGQLQIAMNAVSLASQLDIGSLTSSDCTIEYAKVLWAKGEHALAIQGLSRLLEGMHAASSKSKKQSKTNQEAEAKLLSELGAWNATARLQSTETITTTYFEPAENLAERSPKELASVFVAYARFADSQLRAHDAQEEEMSKLEDLHRRKTTEYNALTGSGRGSGLTRSSSSAEATHADSARKQAHNRLELDGKRILAFHTGRADALALTTRLYARVLRETDEHDEIIFRLVALWLEHHADDSFNMLFAGELAQIPSHKFVRLSHQLSARLSKMTDSSEHFKRCLEALLSRLTEEHPFHVLYHFYALRASTAASTPTTGTPKGRKSRETSSQVHRTKLASDYFAAAKKSPKWSRQVAQLESACDAYVEAADASLQMINKKSAIELPSQLKLLKLHNLGVPVSTYELPVDKTCTYAPEMMPCIVRYEKRATLMSGIHHPARITCVSSQGTKFTQLVKGGDDVRQDAVMQQVFGIVNDFLEADATTRQRALHIRRYKVIPLAGETGLLEFARNTRPFGTIIEPLHKLYRPKDWDNKKARELLKEAARTRVLANQVAAFREVLKHIKPVFRHHFRDRRTLATPWFEMRTAYQRSVAVNSIVGWMLGIGDRHVSNLLFDDSTGEIVPIDFGIAFDAGELLAVPELVPFRLTQDVIDGLGLTGVEGVFRRCSEEILRVLREQSDTIMSILEVLKYDPLQKWTFASAKAKKMQDATRSQMERSTDEEDVPADAARALSGVAAKLSNTLSVQQRVTELIRQATADENLGTIFHGWQAFF